eukprot:CAMPEP_0205833206 /NCGR_PEP_ID=MMETSP0206-20130828/49028_1 /ASSEMBLY_ACC=CAM_ASM_000279 /TAXON_ID=36767 /ORGANISM="Euplotes focardii, Strain TN1" /LENGTH=391 /DNA_ID=CAMNT_0053139395 /DNA_START=653 /DNA_END=1828 /DNA_ORIENTATION=-
MKYILKVELTYNLVDKSKIGKSFSFFLRRSQYLKITYNIKALISEVERADERISEFVRDYFFDENYYDDSDISSYHSESPVRKIKPMKKSTHGLDMLLKASQKIGERANSRRVPHSSSFVHSPNSDAPLRKFSVTENTFLPQTHMPSERVQIETPPRQKTIPSPGDMSNSLLFEHLLREQKKTRSYCIDLSSLPFGQSLLEPSSGLENLLTEYLLNMPVFLDEFYKVIGELYVAELLKQRPEIGGPSQLMKELLLGHLPANHEYKNSSLISLMMALASRDRQAENQHPRQSDHDQARALLQNHFTNNPSSLPERQEEAIREDQNMVDIAIIPAKEDVTKTLSLPASKHKKSQKKRREQKREAKEKDKVPQNSKNNTQSKLNKVVRVETENI